ncbi:MAG: hypothetical protein KDC07_10675, partial [Chitinophagaceae bacterium]|nr:hypothetical protein [Chitinophagaceae bacterium]
MTSLIGLPKANACHFAAADISIRYVGPGADGCSGTTKYWYIVELDIYYACISCQGTGGTTATIQYASASAQADGLPNPSGNFVATDPQTNIDTVHQLCAQFDDSNSCKTNLKTASRYPAFKVRRHVSDTLKLPYARTDWRFWWSGSARSNSNVNLGGCGSLYVEAMLDNLTKYNNSTVKFLSNPLPYICVNQPNTYLNGPYDPDGDSINVEIQPPYTSTGTQCNYTAPSTYANPIVSSTGFNLNKTTGSVDFKPTQTGQFVLAFRGEDYLKGTNIRLSYVYRDVQVSVLPCTEPPPGIDSLTQAIASITNGTVVNTQFKGQAVFVCPGSDMEFDLNSKSADPSHNVYMYANTGLIPGSSFTTTGQGTGNVTGTFKWTPTTSDIGEHTLVVQSKDSTCLISQPIVLTNYRVILIKVLTGIDAGPDQPVCELNPKPVQLFVRGYEDLRLKWTLNGGPAVGISDDTLYNPTATVSKTTDYVVSTVDLAGSCRAKDTVTLFIDETNKVTITPKNPNNPDNALVLCRPGYIQMEALLSGKPPKNNVACGVGNPTICSKQDTGAVFGSELYGNLAFDTIGTASPIMYNTLRTSRMQYLIRRGEMNKSDIFSSTIRSLSLETKGTTTPTYAYSNFRIYIKCTEKEQLSDKDGFENFGMTQVYSAANVTFDDGEHFYPFTTPYSWDTTKNLIIQFCFSDNPTVDTGCGVTSAPPVVKYVPTTYVSGLTLKGADATVTSVCGVDKDPTIAAILGRPAFRFAYCEADPLDFIITWNKSEYLSDSTITQPLAYVPKSTSFVVQ